jgi:hypothetical protein
MKAPFSGAGKLLLGGTGCAFTRSESEYLMTTHVAHAETFTDENPRHNEHGSGVSWPAIFAGALVAAALSLVLLILGVGLGLSSVSPWSQHHGEKIGIAAIAWLAFTQLASAGVGGYLAGRLRVRWSGIHTDEVYFRDTAHGLLAWALAAVAGAALLGGVTRGIIRDVGSHARYAHVMKAHAACHSAKDGNAVGDSSHHESERGPHMGGVSKEDVDQARKGAAHSALWTFVALMLGAFVASIAATFGGRHRDDIKISTHTRHEIKKTGE